MKTLLIDDHPLILSALRTVIHGLRSDVDLVTAETAQQAREALAAHPAFDLVLLDLQLGDADGFELLVELREAYPSMSVVVISASDRSADILRAIELGAMGFVPKRASNELLFEALNMVMSGGIYVPPMAMRSAGSKVEERDAGLPGRNGNGGSHDTAAPSLESFGLTPRQTQVLALLLRGQSNKLIARELNLSVETIKDHVAAVLRALKVASRTQAVLAVSRMSHQGGLLAQREPIRHEARPG
jgi:DNA-binding NarL/FixJ family response regulator